MAMRMFHDATALPTLGPRPRSIVGLDIAWTFRVNALGRRSSGFRRFVDDTHPGGLRCPVLRAGTMDGMDRELRDWLRSLAVTTDSTVPRTHDAALSDEAADYLERIAEDGTLKAALNEIATAEPELAG